MNIKCPWCGARGTDRRPPSGDYREPTEAEKNYAFEMSGNDGTRPVRKCLNCGNGVKMAFLPPRFRKVPPEQWEEIQVAYAEWKSQFEETDEEREERRRAARIAAGLEEPDLSED